MAKKLKLEFEHKCESCGHLQELDESKSNKNWTVYSSTCNKCGGKVKMVMIK